MSESISKSYDVAIIGGGFGGVAVALQIGKESIITRRTPRCILFEPRDSVGTGVAYSTNTSAHVLNVPASKMSADDEAPDSFVNWIAKYSCHYSPSDFVPRYLYRKYLSSLFNNLDQGNLQFKIIKQHVCRIRQLSENEIQLETEDGNKYSVAHVVLAVGNSPASIAGTKQEKEILKSPWNAENIAQAANSTDVALVGTGLTAVDTVLALEGSFFKGSYTLISRKGLLPHPHPGESVPAPLPSDIERKFKEATGLRILLRDFRAFVSQGIKWHILIDALRPYSHDIWRSFSIKEKQRFIRHLRAYWDSHRHRVPQQSLKILQQLRETGRLKVVRGRVDSCRNENVKIWLSTLNGGHHKVLGPFDSVFNCTGIWNNLKDSKSPLIDSMIENNLAAYDDLFLGLRADGTGQLINKDGLPVRGIYTLGSMRRGELWETTAVREIRQQARKIAKVIMDKIVDKDLSKAQAHMVINER